MEYKHLLMALFGGILQAEWVKLVSKNIGKRDNAALLAKYGPDKLRWNCLVRIVPYAKHIAHPGRIVRRYRAKRLETRG
jgi:hypothetical protein